MDTNPKHVFIDGNPSNVLNDDLPSQAYGSSTEDESHTPASDNDEDSCDKSFVSVHSFESDRRRKNSE